MMDIPEHLSRRRALIHAGLALSGLVPVAAPRAQDAPAATEKALKLGLAPFFSPTAMVRVFRPVRDHLTRTLGIPVEAYTARDQRDVLAKTRAHEYDVILLPAHFAYLACTEWSYVPIVATLQSTAVLLLVRNDSPIRRAEDLKGKRFGLTDRLALIPSAAFMWLRGQGIDPERDIEQVLLATGNGTLYALSRGDIDVCAISGSQLQDMPSDTPRDYRVLQDTGSVMAPVYVASASLGESLLARLRAAFLSFEPRESEPRTASNTRLRPLQLQDLKPFEPYAADVKRALLR